jgi:hypothetical protein
LAADRGISLCAVQEAYLFLFKQNIIDIRLVKIDVCLQYQTEWDLSQMSETGYVQKF